MNRMNYWDEKWDLNIEKCPCDAHFIDYINECDIKNSTIFHFGTGNHHLLGKDNLKNQKNNSILGITASPEEYFSYIQMVINKPEVAKDYQVYFGDIYLLNSKLLPKFNVVTLFHLCEFRTNINESYGAMSDYELILQILKNTEKNGIILFYKKSKSFKEALPIIENVEQQGLFKRKHEFETLVVYSKL